MTRQRSGSSNAMFFRLLMRATMVKPGRVISALLAVVVAASVATAMMNLYVDVQAKLRSAAGRLKQHGSYSYRCRACRFLHHVV